MAAERTGRRAISARLVAVLSGPPEEPPAVSRAAVAADVAIAAVATIAGVVAVIMQARTGSVGFSTLIVRPGIKPVVVRPVGPLFAPGWPSSGILLGAVLTTAPLAFRRVLPPRGWSWRLPPRAGARTSGPFGLRILILSVGQGLVDELTQLLTDRVGA